MAGVFLSYARDDTAKARQIAAALEKAGHSVWWDLHVRGGTQFSKVIEEALTAADVVVVLWSVRSVDSPWVRDEAATGRDRGRLVPVALDAIEPPLGFRQFQTIDISGWRGRGNVPRQAEILRSIDGAVGVERPPARPEPVGPGLLPLPGPRPLRLVLLALIVFAAIALAYFLVNRGGKSGVRIVAITSVDPSAQSVARELLSNLGNIQSVQAGSVKLLDGLSRERPDLILEAGAAARKSGANLALRNAKDNAVLWSKEFGTPSGSPADLELQITYTAGRVLGCALEGLESGGKALGAPTLKLYLTGCSQYAEGDEETRSTVVSLFEQVVENAPKFEGGWAKLLLAESEEVAGDPNHDADKLRRYIAAARKLDPKMPEATLAEVVLLPPNAFGEVLRLLDRAKERNPENPAVLSYRSVALARVGRMTEAIEDAKQGVRLDPTSPDALSNYVLSLAHSGRIEAAREELQRAERLWPGTGKLKELQYAFLLRYGDPKEMLKSERFKEANPRMQLYFRTKADPTSANVDHFMAFLQELYRRRGLTANDVMGHAQAYGEFNKEGFLYDLIGRLPPDEDLSMISGVLFRPSLREFRHDRRFMAFAKRIGLLEYWQKSGKWPDFCFDPDQPYDCKAEAAKLS